MKNLSLLAVLVVGIAVSPSQSHAQSFNDIYRSSITVDTIAGFGTTGTKVRTFVNSTSGPGKAISYVKDAVNGDSFRINQSGIYSISVINVTGTSIEYTGISVNADPTVGLVELPRANRLCVNVTSSGDPNGCSVTVLLKRSDVIRAQVELADDTNGVPNPQLGAVTVTRVNR
jgi:hypothetical protein